MYFTVWEDLMTLCYKATLSDERGRYVEAYVAREEIVAVRDLKAFWQAVLRALCQRWYEKYYELPDTNQTTMVSRVVDGEVIGCEVIEIDNKAIEQERRAIGA